MSSCALVWMQNCTIMGGVLASDEKYGDSHSLVSCPDHTPSRQDTFLPAREWSEHETIVSAMLVLQGVVIKI